MNIETRNALQDFAKQAYDALRRVADMGPGADTTAFFEAASKLTDALDKEDIEYEGRP